MRRRVTVIVYMFLVLLMGGGLAMAQSATVSPSDLRATASALQTQAASQERSDATAQAQATAGTQQVATKDGKPLSPEQQKLSDKLWRKVTADINVLYVQVKASCTQTTTINTGITMYGKTPEEAWNDWGNEGDGRSLRGQRSRAVDDFLAAKAVSDPPAGMGGHVPTYFELAQRADAELPGCSTGEYHGG